MFTHEEIENSFFQDYPTVMDMYTKEKQKLDGLFSHASEKSGLVVSTKLEQPLTTKSYYMNIIAKRNQT